MSIAAGTGRLGRTSRAGSSRPGIVGRAVRGVGRVAGALDRIDELEGSRPASSGGFAR
jgi:hypothetical protein